MKKKLIVLYAILLGLVLCGFSQDTSRNKLDSILIIGVRGDRKTPITQKTITDKEIQKFYQGQEVPILLDKTSSITSSSDGGHPQGYTYFRIRGIDQTRINMTLNGVPLNEPEDQGVYTSNYPGFSNVLKSVQIQRGVGTSTNGVSSYGGSISFQSQDGFEKNTELDLGYGSFNTKRLNLTNSTGLHNNFSLFTNLSMYSSDGYKYHSGGSGFSAFISGGYYGGKDIVKITSFTGRSINQMAWLAVSESDIYKDRKTNDNIGDAEDDFRQSFIQLEYTKLINPKSKISTTIFYNRLGGQYDYFESGKKSVTLSSNFYGIISNYQFKNKNLKINFGINLNTYNREHINSEDHTIDYGIGLYKNNGIKNEFGTYIKLSYDINRFTLFSDIQQRYTNFKYQGDVIPSTLNTFTINNMTASIFQNMLSWSFLNPKIGLMYNKKKYLNYYFSISKSNREPTRTDLFGGQDNLVSLSNIKAEEVVDYELGLNFKRHGYTLQGNLYYMDFKNEITFFGAVGTNSLPLMTNVSKSFRSGIEIDILHSSIFDIISTSLNMNYSFNRIKDNGSTFQPLYTPNLIINHSLIINIHSSSVSLDTKYNSSSFISMDNKYKIPAFILFGINISHNYGKYTFALQGNNLLNNKYYTRGYIISNTKYLYTNALSNFYITIKRKF